MLHIQKFLAEHSLAELLTRYSVKHKRHAKHPNLVLLKYDQIASPFHEPLVRECRGIILDEANGWAVVARAFDKFFNHGEPGAADIDWGTARVQEKVDGSLCMLYHYAGEWHVATTGTPDASGPVGFAGMTFADLFWQTWRDAGNSLPAETSVLVFELCTPFNRIIVRHAEAHLVLIGARAWMYGDLVELPVRAVQHLVRTVPEHPLTSMEEVLATFGTLDPLKQEGYVVVDAQFNRVKVKHPGYVALHHMKGNGAGPTEKRLLDICRKGEQAEVLSAFPEWTDAMRRVDMVLNVAALTLDACYKQWKDIPVQKDFAEKAKGTDCPAALFAVRSGKAASIAEFFATMRLESLMQVLGFDDSQEEEAAQ